MRSGFLMPWCWRFYYPSSQSLRQKSCCTVEQPDLKKTIITNEIRKLRFNNGEMTQKELATRVGVTRQTIIAIENSKYSPTLELAFKIAGVFEVSIDAVFSYDPLSD